MYKTIEDCKKVLWVTSELHKKDQTFREGSCYPWYSCFSCGLILSKDSDKYCGLGGFSVRRKCGCIEHTRVRR